MTTLLNTIADKWFIWQFAMLWQTAVLIGIIWAVDLLIRKWAWPQVRYALWMLVLIKLLIPPTWTSPTSITSQIPAAAFRAATVMERLSTDTPDNMNITPASSRQLETPDLNSVSASMERSDTGPKGHNTVAGGTTPGTDSIMQSNPNGATQNKISLSWKVWSMFVWLAGIAVLSAWLIVRLSGLRREHTLSVIPAPSVIGAQAGIQLPERFHEQLQSAAQKLNLKRLPQVILTDKVSCPAVFGIFRPVLLMPAEKFKACNSGTGISRRAGMHHGQDGHATTARHTEHILLHELAHIKRGDLLVHAVYMMLQIAYWFNPLLWMIRRTLQNLRELCCDATVAKLLKEDTVHYRQTLLETARQLLAEPVDPGLGLLGLFENSNWLVARLKWLEKKTWKNRPLRIATIFVLVALMTTCVLPMGIFDPGPPNFVIKGTVTDAETGRPVAGAKVGDTKEYNGGKFCTIADPNGHYEYKTWYEEHGVTAEADGYKRQGKGFGTKLFGSEKEKVINFELTKNSELKAKNFTATLPSGVTVELVGVCEHPSDGKQWWNPDGLLMGELVFELKGRRPYDKPYFGYMLQFEPPEDLTFRTSTDVDAFISTSSINTKGQAIAWLGYNEGHSNTPEIPETARITVKVAGGDWQTREPGKYEVFRDIVNFDDERILLSGLRSDPDDSKQTLIEATASGDDIDIKLVCVTKNGKSHEVTHSGMLRAGGKMIQHSFSLRAPIDEIEKIIVNYRKFHTVTFKNVSLRPNGKTEGRIKTEEQELKTTETDAKETRQETFNDILKSESRWDIIRRLNTWETALSAGDIETLERIVQETTHNDWEMNYSARSLLRRNLPRKYNVTPEVANAEEFFVKLRDGKVSSGAYDKFVDDIAGIGNDIVPMLLDMLKYDKPHDFYRENIAIKALGHMQDIRIIPALKKAIVSEEHRNQLEQIILSILRSDSSNAMVDYVASVIVNQKSSFDQEYIIRLISQSNTPYEAKKRLYFHYAEFKDYGKRAVIRGYGKMDDQEAFTQLVRILREDKYGGEFRVAVNELNNLKNSDPSAIFFEYLKKVPDHVCDDLIIPLAERNYLPAIPVLEERITNAGDSVDGARCKVWATGALCKLGKDYEKNSAIIREHLKKEYDPHAIGYAAYGVAGWLNDEETIKLLSQKICSENSNTDVLKWSIKALGQIGDKSALTALREALTILPLDLFIDIAEAIEAIGHDHNDQEIISEGKIIQTVTRTLRNTGGQQIVFAPGSPEANIRQRNYEKTLEWLAQHREVGTNIIKNLDSSWNKDAIIELIKTNVEN